MPASEAQGFRIGALFPIKSIADVVIFAGMAVNVVVIGLILWFYVF